MRQKIKLGISTCLLGEKVRYDGGHKMDHFLSKILGEFVEFVPVCPEVEAGFGIPREAFRLVGNSASPRLMTVRSKVDWTERMVAWARERVEQLAGEDLRGFIFKSKSPSSGLERVKVYSDAGIPTNNGVGIFARIFTEKFPLLPVEEEGRLNDLELRENFIERIFVFDRWCTVVGASIRTGALVDFHTRHKLLIRSHSESDYRVLGRIIAHLAKDTVTADLENYHVTLMKALKLKATVKKHCNVLQHIMGYFKRDLSSDEKQELLEIIDRYRQGFIPLIVPLTLLNHYVRKYEQHYLQEQFYLNPHPLELKLRNHA